MHHKKKVGVNEEEVKNINCLLEVKEQWVVGMDSRSMDKGTSTQKNENGWNRFDTDNTHKCMK